MLKKLPGWDGPTGFLFILGLPLFAAFLVNSIFITLLGNIGAFLFAIAMLIYCQVKKMHFGQWADYIAPGLLIAQGVGRWGNFVNQELYGSPSNLPWAIKIAPEYRLPGFEAMERYHPLFFYEFALNLIAAGILLLLINANRKKHFLLKGDIFLLYLVFYPAIRFGLEFLRLDPSAVSGYNINQTIMGIVAVLAIVGLVVRHFMVKPGNPDGQNEGLDLANNKRKEPEILENESELGDPEIGLEENAIKKLNRDFEELRILEYA